MPVLAIVGTLAVARNRELAYLRRALKLGVYQDPPLVLRVPHFEMLPENNVAYAAPLG